MPQQVPHETLAPGTVLINRYRVEQVIGSGGYASVYKVTDLQYGYERAVKEVSAPDAGVREQFRLEADVLVNVQNPNVPRGYNVFEVGRRIYFVMDFVQGKDLEELLNDSLVQRHRPLEEKQTLEWAIEICGALHQLHSMPTPIIHRDIKPANIKITPSWQPVLIDFGLAKLQERSSNNVTHAAAQGVSPGFAPPEQYMARGRTDARTDIYGLGATLYACLTGRDPTEAPARLLAQTGMNHGASLDPVRKHNPRVSERTERVILKALELAPARRQQSARDLQEELRQALQALNASSAASAVTPPQAAPRPAENAQMGRQSGKGPAVRPGAAAESPRAAAKPAVPAPTPIRQAPPAPAATAAQPAARIVGAAAGAAAAAAIVDQRAAPKANKKADKKADKSDAAMATSAAAPAVTSAHTAQKPAAASAADSAPKRTLLTAQQPAIRTSGKHAAVPQAQQPLAAPTGSHHPVLEAKDTNARAMVQGMTGATAAATATAVAEPAAKSGSSGKRAKKPAKVSAPQAAAAQAPAVEAESAHEQRAWIRLGKTQVSTFGKWMLALASIETLWGVVALSLGIIALINHGVIEKSFLVKLGAGWLVAVLIISALGGQALTRPIYRRGNLTKMRRGLQGTGLAIFTVVVHGVALWGASIFTASPGNGLLAVIAYIIFAVNILVAGALSVATVLD